MNTGSAKPVRTRKQTIFGNRTKRLARLAALDPEHKEMALQFLCGFSPVVFDVILNATEPIGGYSIADDAEPFCLTCHQLIGVFPATGEAWRHYRGDGITTRSQPYEADHRPALGWRAPTDTAARYPI